MSAPPSLSRPAAASAPAPGRPAAPPNCAGPSTCHAREGSRGQGGGAEAGPRPGVGIGASGAGARDDDGSRPTTHTAPVPGGQAGAATPALALRHTAGGRRWRRGRPVAPGALAAVALAVLAVASTSPPRLGASAAPLVAFKPTVAADTPGAGACEDTMFDGLNLEFGRIIVQPNASWLRQDDVADGRYPNTPTLEECGMKCEKMEDASTPTDLSSPVCVFVFCDPANGKPCTVGDDGEVDPGLCLVDSRSLPFPGRRPTLLSSGPATTSSGTSIPPAIAALAKAPVPSGFTLSGTRSFFLASFNGRCTYNNDASFNASLADRSCIVPGTVEQGLAACKKIPGCGGITYYPVKGGPFAGGIGSYSATMTPEFLALPGVSFIKYGHVNADCSYMSPYSLLYTRDGGPADAAAAAAFLRAGHGNSSSSSASANAPVLDKVGARVGVAVGVAILAALLAGLGVWGITRVRARQAAQRAAVAGGGGGAASPATAAAASGRAGASSSLATTKSRGAGSSRARVPSGRWPALRPSAFAAFARSLSEGARSRRWSSSSTKEAAASGKDVESGGTSSKAAAGGVSRRPFGRAPALASSGPQSSLDKLMADVIAARSVAAAGLARSSPSAVAARAASAPAPPLDGSAESAAAARSAALTRARTAGGAGADGGGGGGSPAHPSRPVTPSPAQREEWELDPAQVSIARRPDGSDWLLGAGAAAHVYRGLLNGIQDVAIKVWVDPCAGGGGCADADAAAAARKADLRRETAILRSLRDRNIVAFVGACLRDGCNVLVTEYCSRGDLYRALAADGRVALSGAVSSMTAGTAAAAAGAADTPTAAGRTQLSPTVSGRSGGSGTAGGGGASGGTTAAIPGGRRFTWTPSYTFTARGAVRRRPGTGLCWSVAADITKALYYLHHRGIIHLDVKSANVLLTADFTAKLADVGVSRALRPGGATAPTLNAALGTLAWAAPEVLLGGKHVGVAADIYSFGCVLWELCTQEAPPDNRHLRPVSVPDEAPAEVEALMLRCLATDPADRPSAAELVRFFEAGLAALDAAAGVKGAGVRGGAGGALTTSLAALVGRASSSGVPGVSEDDGSAALAEAREARLKAQRQGSEGGA